MYKQKTPPTALETLLLAEFVALYQLCMILNCLLNSLRLNADIPLGGGSGTMLQKPLHQRNIEAVGLVYLRCIPLAETVGTDTLVP